MQYCTRNMDVIDGIINKNNFNGATDPGVNDDVADGYAIGSNWLNSTNNRWFIAESVLTGAAVWRQIYPSDIESGVTGPTGPTGLTGAAGSIVLFNVNSVTSMKQVLLSLTVVS